MTYKSVVGDRLLTGSWMGWLALFELTPDRIVWEDVTLIEKMTPTRLAYGKTCHPFS